MTAVTASIEIAVPPERVWDVIMDPSQFSDWVTIHRKLGRVDDGELREGFRVEQTLCLHHANFKVKWSLAEVDAPLHAVWEGRGPAGSHARIVDELTPLDGGGRRASTTATSTPAGRVPRPHGGPGPGRRRGRARGEPVARSASRRSSSAEPAAAGGR